MSSRLPLETYAADPRLSSGVLSEILRNGSLALVLGAGVSAGMGLPKWWKLVKECSEAAGRNERITSRTPIDKLLRIMSEVEREVSRGLPVGTVDIPKYHQLVRERLYAACADDNALLRQELLSVIAAMTMPSRRGAATEVVTFNFDDVLERYLDWHGFAAQVIVDLPQLRRDADVTVYHPHGFLASPGSTRRDSRTKIVFSEISFDERLGDRIAAWQEAIRDLLLRKYVLFIGLSLGSSTLRTIITDATDDIRANRGPTGFWLLGPDDGADVEPELLSRNIVPVRCRSYPAYPKFLLGVCQNAAMISTGTGRPT